MDSAPAMAQLSLDDTLGAAFLGNIAAACLYGGTVVQTYIYYGRNGGDRLYLKLLVFFLWLVPLSRPCRPSAEFIYYYAVKDFSNPLALEIPIWSIMAQVVVTGVSDLIVRSIFCDRVWKCTPISFGLFAGMRNPWESICTVLIAAKFEDDDIPHWGSLAFAIKGLSLASFADLFEVSTILYISLGSGVLADVLIAASMCVLLAQRRTGFSRTDSIVRVLTMYSINTGALTSLCALLCLVSYATMPTNFVFIAFYFVLPKLFLNSLLATLNARRPLREADPSMVSIPLATTSTSPYLPPIRPARHSLRPRNASDQSGLQIQVHTATELKTDPAEQQIMGGPDEASQKFWQDFYARIEEPHETGTV
ncbi:uncharacterized protein TRAVEDRAFT_73541 [Trametes versicolor FP-101664 SS1]|uniref:uncharacterized protein n=1 Tax=Trametes versicolor (strain FP-101664) TaxID=717944 RepID=UPI00046214D7|nr:uncharacterized protein TRAVEDRAFT_73541 [Trametes versicolor FP-101664 SS1]EIW55740.1 hypothetical protein TRAVEDRAFT_73541 [Trametes versicolor FP-101664 SS1]